MPEWIPNPSTNTLTADLPILVTRLSLAWGFGWAVAWLSGRKAPTGSDESLNFTLMLMSILIAMATQIIGDNVARAFSLVGALSIVRFRTTVAATRDVAFVLASVVVGMAVGAGQYYVASIGTGVVGLATFAFNRERSGNGLGDDSEYGKESWKVTIQTGLNSAYGLEEELNRHAKTVKLVSTETIRRGSAFEVIFRIIPRSETSLIDLCAALNALPAVESASAKSSS